MFVAKQDPGGAVPVPLPSRPLDEDPRRLWIGNLDPRVTEFALLKILQKYGDLEKFDFLYHKSGPDKGKARGYCFASYASKQEAEKAMRSLNGKLALSKRMAVRWAHAEEEPEVPSRLQQRTTKQSDDVPAQLSSADAKIRAIEAKLQVMDRTQKEFSLSLVPEAPPGSSQYSKVKASQAVSRSHHTRQPYRKNHKR